MNCLQVFFIFRVLQNNKLHTCFKSYVSIVMVTRMCVMNSYSILLATNYEEMAS